VSFPQSGSAIDLISLRERIRRAADRWFLDASPLCGPSEVNRPLLEGIFESFLKADAYLSDKSIWGEILQNNPRTLADFLHIFCVEDCPKVAVRVFPDAANATVETYLGLFSSPTGSPRNTSRSVNRIIDCLCYHWLALYVLLHREASFTHYVFTFSGHTTPSEVRKELWRRITHESNVASSSEPPERVRVLIRDLPILCIHGMQLREADYLS